MDPSSLPENVRKLLLEHVHSYEQLEILLKVYAQGSRSWTPSELARELGVEEDTVVAALEHLRNVGLVRLEQGVVLLEPRTQSLKQAIEDLAQAYAQSRFAIIELMSTSSIERLRSAAIRTFAEAFRMKGPKKNV